MKEKYKIENFKPLVEKSSSIRDLCRLLNMAETGRNFYTMKKYIKIHRLNTDHHLGKREQLKGLHFSNKRSTKEVLVKNSTYLNNHLVKNRLLEEDLLEYKCERCKNKGTWLKEDLVLQLDHKNGIRNDNRLENLRFLYPNCHSQTNTFAGKNVKV